jgi:hypothetical protein
MTETKMKLSLAFNKPEFVSSYGSDQIALHFLRPELLLIRAEATTRSKFVAYRNVPKQTTSSSVESAEATAVAGAVGL